MPHKNSFLKRLASKSKGISLDLFKTKEHLSPGDVSQGQKYFIMDGVCSLAMVTLQGGPFLPAFALALGASNYEIGLLVTIAFLSQFMQIPGLVLVQSFRKRRAITFIFAMLSRILWIFIILIPVLFVNKGVFFLLQWLFVSALVGALIGPAWNSLIRDIIPYERLGRIVSRRLVLGTSLALALTLLGGKVIDWWQDRFPDHVLYGYSLLFTFGLFFGLYGLYSIFRLPEPAMKSDKSEPFLDLIVSPVKDRNFRKLLIFIAAWNFSINMVSPFFIVYMLSRIKISLFLVTILTVTTQLINILFLGIWGRLADRYSNKSVLSVSGPMFLLAILAWCFTTLPEKYFLTLPLLFLIHIVNGISLSGISLASGNIALKLSPADRSHGYMTVFSLAGAITGAIAPLIGGAIADIFAQRELNLTLNWTEPSRAISIYALNFRALDFLFFLGFLVGFYALRRLNRVVEEGEVTEYEVIEELINETVLPLRALASVEGMRRLAFLPFFIVLKLYRIRKNSAEK